MPQTLRQQLARTASLTAGRNSSHFAQRDIATPRFGRSRKHIFPVALTCIWLVAPIIDAAGQPPDTPARHQPQFSLAEECNAEAARRMRGRRINFEFDKSTIRPSARGLLDALVDLAADCSGLRIIVTGHTDTSGNARYNLQLSKRRADAVRDYLISRGISAARIEAVGAGDSQPLAGNDSRAARARNRRIEFSFVATSGGRYSGSGRPSIPASSTSNTSVDPGGMTAPAPRSP